MSIVVAIVLVALFWWGLSLLIRDSARKGAASALAARQEPVPVAPDVACPVCAVGPGEPCVRVKNRQPLAVPHWDRVKG